jgi:hypothetical protein
MMYIVE